MELLRNLHLHLFRVDHITITPARWSLRAIRDGFWRLYCNDADGASITSGGRTEMLPVGRLAVVPARTLFSTDVPGPIGHFFVHFDALGLPRLAAQELFDRPLLIPECPALQERAAQLALQTAAGMPMDLAQECAVKAVLYESLGLYLSSIPPERMERCGRLTEGQEPVRPALRYIEENLGSELSNPALARLCCLNEDYFIRRFRACTGETPAMYIQERRVTMAAQRLLFSTDPVELIAAEMGFGSRNYFCRVFKQHTGVSPSCYRRTPRW
jgi:AraC-like DNA-binding protein